MIINSIKLKNFMPYYDSHELTLSEGVNLILGVSGKGKSTLFNAFYWVLFGKIHFTEQGWCKKTPRGWMLINDATKSRVAPAIDIINSRALCEQSSNEPVEMSVEMSLCSDDKNQYTITRKILATRISDGNWNDDTNWQLSDDDLTISYETRMGTIFKCGTEAEEVIRGLFNPSIRDYIWFQGESLDKLIDLKNPQTLSDAVKYVSYYPAYELMLNVVERAVKDISKAEQKKLKENNTRNRELSDLLYTISDLETKIDSLKISKSTKVEEQERIQQKLANNEKKYHTFARFTGLVAKYKDCERKFKEAIDNVSEYNDYEIKLTPQWCLRGIDKLMEDAKKIIYSYKEEKFTPADRKYISEPGLDRLEEIMRNEQCFVCGSRVPEGGEAYNFILNRIKEHEEYLRKVAEYQNSIIESQNLTWLVGQIQDYPTNVQAAISLIDNQYQRVEDSIDKLISEKNKWKAKLGEINNEIESVKKQYNIDLVRQADTADIVADHMQINRSSIEKLQREIDNFDRQIDSYSTDLARKKREMENLQSKGGIQSVPETYWRTLSEILLPICRKVQENARYDLLNKIRETSNDLYVEFTKHDDGYKGIIEIADDYSIKVDPRLNTGHTDRKKMSVLNAMLKLNQDAQGVYYPFVTDAPTSNLDTESTFKYIMGIQDVFKQSVIMTNQIKVGTEEYQTLLKQSKVSHVYKIEQVDGGDKPERYEVYSVLNQVK